MKRVLGILLSIFLLSCEKEELPKPISNYELSEIKTLALGEEYRTQIGFSFQNNIEHTMDVMDWDFYIYPDKSIRLNTARFMKIAPANSDFEVVDSNFVYDEYNASNPEYKLIVSETESLWVLDLGRDESGLELLTYEIKVRFEKDLFILKYREHETSDWQEVSLSTTSEIGVFYSILNQKESQNPIFIQSEFYCGGYMTRFEEENLDYLVRGILSNNREKLMFLTLENTDFKTLILKDIESEVFSNNLDEIGFDWKNYDITKALYTVDSDRVYIIKYSNGLHYKFHFIGFYNEQGQKGFPRIEFSLLE